MFKKVSYTEFIEKFGDCYKYDSKISLLENNEASLLLKDDTDKYIIIINNEIFLHKLDFIKDYNEIVEALKQNEYKGTYTYKKLGNKKDDEILNQLEIKFVNYEDVLLTNCFAKDFGPHDVNSHSAVYQFEVK